jgi:hypothetical protein
VGILSVLLGAVLRQEQSQPDPHQGRALEDSFRKDKPRDPEQLVGRKCRGCKDEIAIQKEAQRCPSCKKPIHRACLDGHVAACAAPPAPYR